MGPCKHLRRGVGREYFGATGYHLAERCLDCWMNVRGPGTWVPRSEVADPEALPVFRPPPPQRAPEPSLFDGMGGGES